VLNPDERAERQGLLSIISALLEDRLWEHDLRKLLGNVAVDRHLQLHTNMTDEQRKELASRPRQTQDIMSFISCTDNFCVNVNKLMREFKKPEFTTNSLILQSMEAKYEVIFDQHEGALTVSLKDRRKDAPKIITLGSEVTQ
jgi:hypothetical protein